ncbi:ABC transporter permease [Moorena sp. SIO3H5]|uniref:ABC transporter permease n=1 Tax=Moorena sp. SIO3H5 TaxID=2607834 RepID=UPI0013BD6FC3|nr:ABC transporter permease [Moorena sp. SIO3H5]NEO72059.1 ABC transporter permease [Moorena sp. SIO3H5]
MPPPISSPRKRYLRPSVFWSIRQGFPGWLSIFLTIIALVVPLLVWIFLSYQELVDPRFLPSPMVVLKAGWKMLTEEQLLTDIIASFTRVLVGFLFAAVVGIPIGIAMGTFYSMESLFGTIVGIVRYMPVAAFMPLIVLWAGLGETAKIIIIFLGIVFYNAIMIADAVKFIPDEMLNVAYTLGANRVDVLFRVILPATLPNIIDTMRVNVAGAWNFLVIAELIAAENGLGFKIIYFQRFLETDKVLFCILVIGLIGLMLDFGFRLLFRLSVPWSEQFVER